MKRWVDKVLSTFSSCLVDLQLSHSLLFPLCSVLLSWAIMVSGDRWEKLAYNKGSYVRRCFKRILHFRLVLCLWLQIWTFYNLLMSCQGERQGEYQTRSKHLYNFFLRFICHWAISLHELWISDLLYIYKWDQKGSNIAGKVKSNSPKASTITNLSLFC